jgi:hypothetical protein
MKWVHTDLNSPWCPIESELGIAKIARDFPEQYRRVSNELHVELRAAWDALMEVSDKVDEQFPLKDRK